MIYEYRIEVFSARGNSLDVNAVGRDGWRLVSVAPANMVGEMLLFFEREVAVDLVVPSRVQLLGKSDDEAAAAA
jgi:hypothetical protein